MADKFETKPLSVYVQTMQAIEHVETGAIHSTHSITIGHGDQMITMSWIQSVLKWP